MSRPDKHWQITCNQIRAGRMLAGLGIRGLAERCGLSTTSVHQIESGKTESPRPRTLDSLESTLRDAGVEFIRGGWVRHRDDKDQEGGQLPDEFMQQSIIIDKALQLVRQAVRVLSQLKSKRPT